MGTETPFSIEHCKQLAIAKMDSSIEKIDTDDRSGIMTPEEVARYLRKSLSWVYKNWRLLGGRKLRGSIFFQKKEDLYEHLFCKEERVEVRLHPQGNQVLKHLVRNQNRGQKCRIQKKGGDSKPEAGGGDPNRHGIFGVGQ